MKAGGRETFAVEVVSILFLCVQQDGILHRPRVAPDRVRRANAALWPGGTALKRPENCGYDLPTISEVRVPGGQGVQTPYDGRGAELTGEATRTGTVSGVWKGFSEGVTGCALPNPA